MKSIKFSLLSMAFVTGSLFAMEDQESSNLNLSVQDELWAAIEENNPEKVKNALENGANPNEYKIPTDESHSYRPLSKAIDNFYQTGSDNSLEIVRYLLENGADPQEVRIISAMIKEPALFYVLRYSDIKNSDLQNQYQIYPLVKLLYTFKTTPVLAGQIGPMATIKNIVELFFFIALTKCNELAKESEERAALLKEDWAKIVVLIYPEIIENKHLSFMREYLEEIQYKFLKDNPNEYLKKHYGSTFNYVQQRQYGLSPRKRIIHKNRTLLSNNNDNSNDLNGKEEA